MNRLALDMPVVGECTVGDCAYNAHHSCQARAITVGAGIHPGCDTFLAATPHSRDAGRHAGVGACKVAACEHNEDYECGAQQIAVGRDGDGACCLTFRRRAPVQPDSRERKRAAD
ncbi:DUF1540 domain-containing protein [Massilia sp. G4R7]|uniref:DUF1540 domain-containing protein n=1 Tax=Massilia phyllostachyos TaxID=2898585 RepID=A0ABS8Q362_9BURK|nr:DUF1540 domain-containing protein [Massilia phyllostachyos]MCD2516182.1 DUF1540 domain-containing protein [Massilia phyllostachyos]